MLIRLCSRLSKSKSFNNACFRQCSTTSKSVEELEQEFTQLKLHSGIREYSRQPENVLIVHPKIRWGANANPRENVGLKLGEASALIQTLPGFSIANTMVIGTDYNVRKKFIWGQGRLDALKEQQLLSNATAVMINVDILSPEQQLALNECLDVPVFDRYNLVLWIFKYYARTKEAHLQISLAEIPYIRTRLKHSEMFDAPTDTLHIGEAHTALSGGKNDCFEVLRLRQHSLRKKLREVVESKSDELEQRRQLVQRKAQRSLLVAIIGYTNAGKTTLIKSLTGATEIFGEDRLFATLDTTLHHAVLPSKCSIFLADTIGFISDLPMNLIASFEATLRHVVNADLLVHIEDLSHPNLEAQRENVMQTLRGLKIRDELIDSMIHVSNKIDKLSAEKFESLRASSDDSKLFISCRSGFGLKKLVDHLDTTVQSVSGTKTRVFRLKPESQLIPYLYSERLVAKNPDVVDDHLEFRVSMTDDQFSRLKAHMVSIGKKVSRK